MKLDSSILSQWLSLNHRRIGVWIIVILLGGFGVEFSVRWLSVPHGVEKLAAQFAAVGAVQQDPAVAVNHAGNLVGLIRSTEDGVGVFIVDLKAKKERLLQRVRDSEYYRKARMARVWGWSADDSFFAHTWGDKDGNLSLFIWNQTDEEPVAQIPLPRGLRTMKWVGSNDCVYIDWSTNLVYLKARGGTWEEVAVWPLPPGPGRPVLEVLDSETIGVAWLGGTELWQVELRSGRTLKFYTATAGTTIDAVRYAPENRAFLISESVRRATTSTLVQVTYGGDGWSRRDIGRWPTIRAVEWINGGRGFAIHIRQGENNYLLVRPDPFVSDAIHFKNGGVLGIFTTSTTGAVYAIASLSNEPPAIWKCSGDDKAQVYSLQGKDGESLRYQPVLVGWAPFNGHNARFELLPPANFSRNKKYPLVIGLASYTWSPIPHAVCAQALANAGAYVALSGFTFREDLRKVSLEHVENINAIYNMMAASPNVDTNRVFIFAFSGSTIAVCELLKRYPGRFKGIILLHPGELPEAAVGMCGRVLLTAGVDESWAAQRFLDYKKELFKVGIPAEVFFHEAGGHIARAQRTMCERVQLMVKTVFR